MTEYNIAGALHKIAAQAKNRIAIVTGTKGRYREWSFVDVLANSNRYANGLCQLKVQRGDRVMLMVRPSMEFICLSFALFQLGAVVILIDPGMGYKNLLKCIGAVRPDVLIGIPQAQLFSRLFYKPFTTVTKRICVGPSFGFLGVSLQRLVREQSDTFFPAKVQPDELAAVIFTTGSTGPPKGVQYTHGIFSSQLELIRSFYKIGPGDVDQPGFPLFALFATALGATAVIPDMDPTRPAQVDPERFIRSIIDKKVSYSFGSPAIWNVVSRYCIERDIVLPVKKILMAGAPVSGELVRRVAHIMAPDGEIYTPYGATESLPTTSITGHEIIEQTWPLTRIGKGACVGRPLPGMTIAVIAPVDGPVDNWQDVRQLDAGMIGEIVVNGPVVTPAYDHNETETAAAKIMDGDTLWHRMGDMGYLDEDGRLWFCGRKAHRVLAADGPMYTICCEAICNEHPAVLRSALVGIGPAGNQQPVMIVELKDKGRHQESLYSELLALTQRNSQTVQIKQFMVHTGFPVDIRHNAKIFREKLSEWAANRLDKRKCKKKNGL